MAESVAGNQKKSWESWKASSPDFATTPLEEKNLCVSASSENQESVSKLELQDFMCRSSYAIRSLTVDRFQHFAGCLGLI